MNDFYYYNPTKIIFGKNSIQKISREISSNKKILMLYGQASLKKNGVYDQVLSTLKDYELHEFPGIEPNPEYTIALNTTQ